jgi:sterol desaturase/sphingolipid hydroxylase (fatty acid hydroxylase superfamily)
MKMSKLGYFSEFLLFPPLVLVVIILAFRDPGRPPLVVWVIVFCVGLAGWTFIEYLLHRLIFHHAPILAQMHERHHNSPNDLIGTPAWASALIALVVVAAPAVALLGFDVGTAVIAGMVTGYLWYVFIHYAAHHWRPSRGSYLYRTRLHHARHHFTSQAGNFGVTTAVWDRIFGTFIEERVADHSVSK